MKTNESFTTELVRWDRHAEQLYKIRRLVFIEEQGIAADRVQDEADAGSWHVMVSDAEGNGIGCGRLQTDGRIDHIAVLKKWRGMGAGFAILNRLLELAQSQELVEVKLNAPAGMLKWYEKLGFRVHGEGEDFFDGAGFYYPMTLQLEIWCRRMAGKLWDGSLESIDESIQAAAALFRGVRRQLCIYTPYVQPKLYNDIDILTALRKSIIEQPRIQCRLLLPPASQWRRSCAHLAQLIERLSAVELRTLPVEEPRERSEFAHGFMIADRAGLIQHTDPRFCTGTCSLQGGAKAKHLQDFFNEFWEKSLPDRELRSLGI